MNAERTAAAGGGEGLLPEARRRLGEAEAALDRLRGDTAWECAAARSYRDSLAELLVELGALREQAIALEYDVRAAWLRTASGGW